MKAVSTILIVLKVNHRAVSTAPVLYGLAVSVLLVVVMWIWLYSVCCPEIECRLLFFLGMCCSSMIEQIWLVHQTVLCLVLLLSKQICWELLQAINNCVVFYGKEGYVDNNEMTRHVTTNNTRLIIISDAKCIAWYTNLKFYWVSSMFNIFLIIVDTFCQEKNKWHYW